MKHFVATFGDFDELEIGKTISVDGKIEPVLTRPWDADGWAPWHPLRVDTPRSTLDDLYAVIPGPVPPLYEQLILSYRWSEVDVGRLRLLGSLPPRLSGLATAITKDRGLLDALAPARFTQFGKGPDVDYDPVCFDLNRRLPDGDCPVVKFDHEEILCNRRLVQVAELAPTFRRLMELVIEDAQKKGRSAG